MSETSHTTITYDVVIIGAGTAGQTAYQHALKSTQRILVINAGEWNTTCARVGCMPSKLIATAAKMAHKSSTAAVFGIHNTTRIDGAQVMQRVQQQRNHFTASAQHIVDQWDNAHKLQGTAHFLDQHTLQVDQANQPPQIISTKTTVVATGSTPITPHGWQDALGNKLLTSDSVFELPDLPHSMAVVGTGAIGLELAQAFARLGVKVYLFARKDLVGGLSHPDLRQQATQLLAQDLTLLTQSSINNVKLDPQQRVHIDYQQAGTAHSLTVDYVLCAIGRSPNLAQLTLDNIDAKYTAAAPKDLNNAVNPATRQLADVPIFMAGDVTTNSAIQHEAANAGRIAGSNAAHYPAIQSFEQYAPLAIVFTDPQMAVVGQSHATLRNNNTPFNEGVVSFARQGRATVMAENHGALHIFACPDSLKFLGAEILSPDAEHLAHLLAWALQQQLSIHDLLKMPFYHPTLEESLRTALSRAKRPRTTETT